MLNDEVKRIWNANAEFWDGKMGEGNAFHKTLIEPTQLGLLNVKPGDEILDIACGNGQFARKMAELKAKVTAIDFSENFIAIAKGKSPDSIQFRVIDAAKEKDLQKLDGRLFDSIVCTMALMDMENIEILLKHLPRLLRKGGVVVFSVLHPCFNSSENVLVHEMDDSGGELKNKYSVKISKYMVERSVLGVGMAGQPKAQYYFHRPLSCILKIFFASGFVLDALEEPSFANIENSTRIYDNVYKEIPPALVCRLRLAE
jgi:2-polyprenyl-3-methyl-5-hydroxy-6-metoxy-1,4-benzoquinol methylase